MIQNLMIKKQSNLKVIRQLTTAKVKTKQISNINCIVKNIKKILQLEFNQTIINQLIYDQLDKLQSQLKQLFKAQPYHYYFNINFLILLHSQIISILIQSFHLQLKIKQKILIILPYLLFHRNWAFNFYQLRAQQLIVKLYIKTQFYIIKKLCLNVIKFLSKYQFYYERFTSNKFVYRGKQINKLFEKQRSEQKLSQWEEKDKYYEQNIKKVKVQRSVKQRQRSRSRQEQKKKMSIVMISRTVYQILLMCYTLNISYEESKLIKEIINNLSVYINGDRTLYKGQLVKILNDQQDKQIYNRQFIFWQNIFNKECKYNNVQLLITDADINKLNNQQLNYIYALHNRIKSNKLDQSVILIISQLILNNYHNPIAIYSFINQLNKNQLKQFRRKQALFTMLYSYLYQILLHHSLNLTIPFIQQIIASLNQISIVLQQNSNIFSKQFAINTKFICNIINIYSLLQKNITFKTFKSLTQKFMNLTNYKQINNKQQYKQYLSKSKYSSFKQIINMGSFFQILPHQSLLQIDLILRIITQLVKKDNTYWVQIYGFKLTVGMGVFLHRLIQLLGLLMQQSVDRYNLMSSMEYNKQLIDNYLIIIQRILRLRLEMTRLQNYSPQNKFINDDLQQISKDYIRLFQIVFNGYYYNEDENYDRSRLIKIMQILTQIFYYTNQNMEYTENIRLRKKFICQLHSIYQIYFSKIQSRIFVLSLFKILYSLQLKSTKLILNKFLLKDIIKTQFLYSTSNICVLDSIIKYSIITDNYLLKNTIKQLIFTIYNQKIKQNDIIIIKIFINYIHQIPQQFKKHKDTIHILKLNYIIQFFHSIFTIQIKNLFINLKLQHNFIKLLKITQDQINQSKRHLSFTNFNYLKQLYKLRNSILQFCVPIYNPHFSRDQKKTWLGFDIPNIEMHKQLFKIVNKFMLFPEQKRRKLVNGYQQIQKQIQYDSLQSSQQQNKEQITTKQFQQDQILQMELKSCQISLHICLNSTKSFISQAILLFKDTHQKQSTLPAINLKSLFDFMFNISSRESIKEGKFKEKILSIFQDAIMILVNLTINPNNGLQYHSKRRKNGMTSLITQRSTPLEQMQKCKVVNKYYIRYLVKYYNHKCLQPTKQIKQKIIKKDIHNYYANHKIQKTDQFYNYCKGLTSVVSKAQNLKRNKLRFFLQATQGRAISSKQKQKKILFINQIITHIFYNINKYTYQIKTQFPIKFTKPQVTFNDSLNLYPRKIFNSIPKKIPKYTTSKYYPIHNQLNNLSIDRIEVQQQKSKQQKIIYEIEEQVVDENDDLQQGIIMEILQLNAEST